MRNAIKTIGIVLAFMAGIVPSARAQTATLAPMSYQTLEDANGDPISGGCVWTYTAGTTTPATTYTSKVISVGTQNTNPIVTDGSGQFVVYLVPGQSYKFTYESNDCVPPAHGSVIQTRDGIDAVPSSATSVDKQGVAGETLSAGNCAYLSDGSGSKTAGRWYKCDSANTYSSTTPEVGMVPTTIASAGTGTIRLMGDMSALSGLTIGAEYFVGTSGALTSTAPANRRHLGHAESTTSFVLTGDPAPFTFTATYADDFRLSLTTATCVTTADVSGASAVTLFLTPCEGNRITLFNSIGTAETCTTAEVSVAVPATTSQMYDVWAYDSSFGTCAVTLELLAWTNDTTRATAIARTTVARYTKSGDLTRLYVGSFRTTTVSGQTEDSVTKRYLWNYYNRKPRRLWRQETTSTWNYTTATIRQANASAANQVDVVIGVQEEPIDLTLNVLAVNTFAGNVNLTVGFGEDSTTTLSTSNTGGTVFVRDTGIWSAFSGRLNLIPAVGRHFYAWLEFSAASGATTWYGTGASLGGSATQVDASGITGSIRN